MHVQQPKRHVAVCPWKETGADQARRIGQCIGSCQSWPDAAGCIWQTPLARCLAKYPAIREAVCLCRYTGSISQERAQAASRAVSVRQSSRGRRPLTSARTPSLGWTRQPKCCTGSPRPRLDTLHQPGKERRQLPLAEVRSSQGFVPLPGAMQQFADNSPFRQGRVCWPGLSASCAQRSCTDERCSPGWEHWPGRSA